MREDGLVVYFRPFSDNEKLYVMQRMMGDRDGRGTGVSVSGAAAGDDEGVVVSAGWLGD